VTRLESVLESGLRMTSVTPITRYVITNDKQSCAV